MGARRASKGRPCWRVGLNESSSPSRLRLARLTLGHFLEVILDDLAIARGHVAGQLGHGLGSFFFGQLAPLLGVFGQSFLIDHTRAAVLAAVTVLLRLRRISSRRTAGLPTVRSGTTVGSGPLLLVLQLLDDFIKSPNHLVLHLLGLRTAAGQLQPPLDVVHLARDPTQVLVLPRLHVVEH